MLPHSHRYWSQLLRWMRDPALKGVLLATLVALAPGIAWGATPPAAASSELDPYVAAAQDAGVPLQVLIAVAGAESGYHPWALDIEGRQVFCKSRAEAETRAGKYRDRERRHRSDANQLALLGPAAADREK